MHTSGCSHSHHHHHHHHHNHGHNHEHADSHVNTGSASIDGFVTSAETTVASQKEEEMEKEKEKESNEVTIEDVPDESNTSRQESRQDRSSAETQSQQDEYVFSCNCMLKSFSASPYITTKVVLMELLFHWTILKDSKIKGFISAELLFS